MFKKHKVYLTVVFFWVLGWVCINPALGADEGEDGELQTIGVEQAIGVEEQPVSLIDDGEEAEADDDAAVTVGSFGEIDLHIKDLELSKVLQLLSLQSQRNIVASRNVSGTISADLYNVDFYEALDAILTTNGFGYREKGTFIYVYTTQELAELEQAERKLTHRVIRLNYLTTSDAATYVAPLLSSAGSISASNDAAAGFQPSVSDGGADSFALEATLVIHDYPDNVDEIVNMIAELDRRPKQVVVEATILEAKLDEDNSFGVDLSVVGDYSFNNFTDPLEVVDQLLGSDHILDDGSAATGSPYRDLGTGSGWQSTVGNTATGKSGFKIGVVTKHGSAFLRALDSVQDTTVVATPKLVVLNRQRADLLSGAKLGYVSTTQSETSNTQTVEFLDIGVQLSLRPFISEDNYVRMELKPSISDGSTQVVEGLVIPNTTNQEVTTNVIVFSGQTIVLGGLFKEDTTVGRNQVPLLGEIPLLGAGFKGQDDTVRRSETIFLITPTVIKDDVMYKLGEQVAEDIEHLQIGARQGLLPWSRSKLTASHMRKATQAYDEGDTRNALWWVNLALSMDSTIIEARNIKSDLTGVEQWAPTRSILDRAIDDLIAEQLGDEQCDQAKEAKCDKQDKCDKVVEIDGQSVTLVEPAVEETVVEEPFFEERIVEEAVVEDALWQESLEPAQEVVEVQAAKSEEIIETVDVSDEISAIDEIEQSAWQDEVDHEATVSADAVEGYDAVSVEPAELADESVEMQYLRQAAWPEDTESAVEGTQESVDAQLQATQSTEDQDWVWDESAQEAADSEMLEFESIVFEMENGESAEVDTAEDQQAETEELVEVEAE